MSANEAAQQISELAESGNALSEWRWRSQHGQLRDAPGLSTMMNQLEEPVRNFATTGLPQILAAAASLQQAADNLDRTLSEVQQNPQGLIAKTPRAGNRGKTMIASTLSSASAVFQGLLLAAATRLLPAVSRLFPNVEPAQLYRFGTTHRRCRTRPTGAKLWRIVVGTRVLTRAAASDRILTVTGTQAAYIKGARWVTSAVDLFDSAVQHAFDADQGSRAPGRQGRNC